MQVVKTMVSEFKSQHLSFCLCWIWCTAEAKHPTCMKGSRRARKSWGYSYISRKLGWIRDGIRGILWSPVLGIVLLIEVELLLWDSGGQGSTPGFSYGSSQTGAHKTLLLLMCAEITGEIRTFKWETHKAKQSQNCSLCRIHRHLAPLSLAV